MNLAISLGLILAAVMVTARKNFPGGEMNSHVDETAVKSEEGDEEIKRAAIATKNNQADEYVDEDEDEVSEVTAVGALRQFFIIDKKVNCEEAEDLCQSQGAQLALMKTIYGPESLERKLFRKYLEIQYNLLSRIRIKIGRPYYRVWVGSEGISSEGKGNAIYIEEGFETSGQIVKKRACKKRFFPVCEIRA